jgi:hypothetical protein
MPLMKGEGRGLVQPRIRQLETLGPRLDKFHKWRLIGAMAEQTTGLTDGEHIAQSLLHFGRIL